MRRLNMHWYLLLVLVGFPAAAQDASTFARVQTYLEQSVEDGAVAGGAVLVWHDGEVVYATGFGYADIKTQRPFEIEMPVIVASISKPMLGTALFRLEDRGKLDLSKAVADYIPAFNQAEREDGTPLKRQPTITELLTHTSGLRSDYSEGGRIWYEPWVKNQLLDKVVDRIAADIPFENQPGEKMRYSGIGTEVAARVGEVASGRPRNEMLRTWLCEPLGMRSTYYRDAAAMEKIQTPMPTRYYIGKESGKIRESGERFLPDKNRYSSSGGTIISTAPDLLNWLLMIRNDGVHEGKQYLSPEAFASMVKPHRIGNRVDGGLAIISKAKDGTPSVLGHTGSSGTSIWIDFETDTIAIILTQTRGKDIRDFRLELDKRIATAVTQHAE